jgi:TP901 family phage tail tape measure protein
MSGITEIIVSLVADTKEYSAKLDEAMVKTEEFQKKQYSLGTAASKGWGMASTAILGAGVAFAGLSLAKAYSFQEAMDKLQNQAGLTAGQVAYLSDQIRNISVTTEQTTGDLANAAITVEQAGFHGANAVNLLTVASKAAVVTNSSLADTIQAIVAAQTLNIAKGKSVADLTGTLVAGSRDFVGGLSAEEQMLQGRVGIALSNYGIKLNDIIALGAVFSKVALPSRSIASFAQGLSNLEKPATTATGKLTTYVRTIEQVGLSYQKLSNDARTGNVVDILNQIQDAARRSGAPLQQLAQAVFGTTGGQTAGVLVQNLGAINNFSKNLAGSGAGSLATSFGTAIHQLGPQLKVLEAKVSNVMISAGNLLLPKLAQIAGWANTFFTYLSTHKGAQSILGSGIATFFIAAAATKIAGVGIKLAEAFGATASLGAGEIGLAIGTGFVAYTLAHDLLNTGPGKVVGRILTAGGQANPINDFANAIAPLVGAQVNPTASLKGPGKQFANWLQSSLGLSPSQFANLGQGQQKGIENKYHVYITARVK